MTTQLKPRTSKANLITMLYFSKGWQWDLESSSTIILPKFSKLTWIPRVYMSNGRVVPKDGLTLTATGFHSKMTSSQLHDVANPYYHSVHNINICSPLRSCKMTKTSHNRCNHKSRRNQYSRNTFRIPDRNTGRHNVFRYQSVKTTESCVK